MAVMEQAIKHSGDRGAVRRVISLNLPPGDLRHQSAGPLIAALNDLQQNSVAEAGSLRMHRPSMMNSGTVASSSMCCLRAAGPNDLSQVALAGAGWP